MQNDSNNRFLHTKYMKKSNFQLLDKNQDKFLKK